MSARKFGLTMLAAGMLAGALAGPALAADKKKDPNKEQYTTRAIILNFDASNKNLPGMALCFCTMLVVTLKKPFTAVEYRNSGSV